MDTSCNPKHQTEGKDCQKDFVYRPARFRSGTGPAADPFQKLFCYPGFLSALQLQKAA